MPKTLNKRKTRSDNFPLTLHPTGQYCKKIRGKLYYFGVDKKLALQRYLEEAAELHTGRPPTKQIAENGITVRSLSNLYLAEQNSNVATGQIGADHYKDQVKGLR